MDEDNFHSQYSQMMDDPDQSTDLDSEILLNKFVEDCMAPGLFDDDASGESLLSFDSGVIKPLSASRDHRRFPTTTGTTEDHFLACNVSRSVLMSNEPGHSPIFNIDDECQIQRVCGSPAPSLFTPDSCLPCDVSPVGFYGDVYATDLFTPVLSPPSSTSSSASSLPTETPPPGILSYPTGIYEPTFQNAIYPHRLTKYTQLYPAPSDSSYTISPEDLTRGYCRTPESRCDLLPSEHSFASAVTPISPQIIHPQPTNPSVDSQKPITINILRPSPRARPYPAITPTLSARFGLSVTSPNDYSQSPEVRPTSRRYRLRSDPQVAAVAATNVFLEPTSNPRLPGPLLHRAARDVRRIRPNLLSPLHELLDFTSTASSPNEPNQELLKPGSRDDDDYRDLLDSSPQSALRQRRRKLTSGPKTTKGGPKPTKRGPNRKYFCKWPGCKAGFTRLWDQERHEETHVGGGKQKCRFCGEELSRKDSLTRHIANKHQEIGSSTELDQDGPG